MVSIPFHTHEIPIPTATAQNLRDGTGGEVAVMPAELRTVLNEDLATKQPLDASLTAFAALTTAADKGLYFTASDTPATFDLTSYGRSLLDDANAAASRVTLGFPATASRYLKNDGSGVPTVLGATETTNLDKIANASPDAGGLAILDGKFPTLATLTADTALTYTAAQTWTVAAGDIIEAAGHRYQVAASGASDQHVTTAGSVKLYVLPGPKGYNVQAFGALPDGAVSEANMYTYLSNAWTAGLANNFDLYFPAGTYTIGDQNMPFRQSGTPVSLLDCGGISLRGDGPQSILKTNTPDGADVLQINGLDNLVIRDLAVTTSLTGTAGSGCNAISITNGFDRLQILDVYIFNMQSVDKTTNIDGGGGISFQPSTSVNINGSAKVRAIVKNCAMAFNCQVDLDTIAARYPAVEAHIIAENCYVHSQFSAGAAAGAISNATHFGFVVTGSAINCQRGVLAARAHGVKADVQVTNTKTAANRRLDFNGTAFWNVTAGSLVESLTMEYAHNSQIRVTGDAGACDFKARIGATTAGSSGLSGASDNVDLYLDLRGTAAAVSITYGTQTATFNVGQTLTGGTSGATGTILADEDNGATGILWVRPLTGTFQNGEIISDNGGSPGSATSTSAPTTADIRQIVSGGNSIRRSRIAITDVTGTIPSGFYTASRLNQIYSIGTHGNNLLGGNIQFPATQVSSSDANCLDDYEEGTWTPILADTSLSDESATYSTQLGTYTKIGNKVYFKLALVVTGLGSLTGGDAAAIIGLPYTSSSTAIFNPVHLTFAANLNLTAAATVSGRILQSVTRITLQKWSATETAGHASMTVNEVSADGQLYMAGMYTTAT